MSKNGRIVYGSIIILTISDWKLIAFGAAIRYLHKCQIPNLTTYGPDEDLYTKFKGVIGEYLVFLVSGAKINLSYINGNDGYVDLILAKSLTSQVKFTNWPWGHFVFDCCLDPVFDKNKYLTTDYYILCTQGRSDDEMIIHGAATKDEVVQDPKAIFYGSLGTYGNRHQMNQYMFKDISRIPGFLPQRIVQPHGSIIIPQPLTYEPSYPSLFKQHFDAQVPANYTLPPNITITQLQQLKDHLP